MNLADVEKALAAIRAEANDDEMAHVLEDGLHQEVLRAIADGACEDPMGCARLALTSKDIEFSRWCA